VNQAAAPGSSAHALSPSDRVPVKAPAPDSHDGLLRRRARGSSTAPSSAEQEKTRGSADGQATRGVRPLPAAFLMRSHGLFIATASSRFARCPRRGVSRTSANVQTTHHIVFPGTAGRRSRSRHDPARIVCPACRLSVRMFSHTQFGLSYLTLTFDDQGRDYFARQRGARAAAAGGFATDIQPQLAPLSTPVGRALSIRLTSDTATRLSFAASRIGWSSARSAWRRASRTWSAVAGFTSSIR